MFLLFLAYSKRQPEDEEEEEEVEWEAETETEDESLAWLGNYSKPDFEIDTFYNFAYQFHWES